MKSLVSLFSGIGGLDEGLHKAGFSPIFCSELDEYARASLSKWLTKKGLRPVLNEDITSVTPHKIKKDLNLKVGELDLLAGGPPCQAFSLIGKRKSLEDDRGQLLFKMLDFARVLKPKAVLIEQVKGLLSAKGEDGIAGSALKEVIAELESYGYSVNYKVLRAADYGVAQLRDRVFIVGLRGKSQFQFPVPTHFPNQAENSLKFTDKNTYQTLSDVIGNLAPPVRKGDEVLINGHVDATPARDCERINGVPEGECLARQLHLPADQRQRLDPKKDTTKFRRMAWGLPALTLRGGEAFYHPTENRYLTPREYMRIHGFEDDHILIGPIRARSGSVKNLDQHRQVANAVPPPLAKAVGSEIFRYLENKSSR